MLPGLLVRSPCCTWYTPPCSRPKPGKFTCVHARTKSQKAPVKASPAFLFHCVWGLPRGWFIWDSTAFPGLFSVLLAEAAEMTAVMLVTKMHWHCTKTINRLFTWATVAWGQISVTINLTCAQIMHLEIKSFVSCYQFFESLAPPFYWIKQNWLDMSCGYWGFAFWWGFFLASSSPL